MRINIGELKAVKLKSHGARRKVYQSEYFIKKLLTKVHKPLTKTEINRVFKILFRLLGR